MNSNNVLVMVGEGRDRSFIDNILSDQGNMVYEARTAEDGLVSMKTEQFDVVVLDLHFPESEMQGIQALADIRVDYPDTPVICLCEGIFDSEVNQAFEYGAFDCLPYPIGRNLMNSINNALEIAQLRKMADPTTKILSGLIPICANCKKIRDEQSFWHEIETYIMAHSEAKFSHGICPDCMAELYPEFQKEQ